MNRSPTLHVYRAVENLSPDNLDFIKDQQGRKVAAIVDSGRMRYLDESMDPTFIRPQDEGKLIATLVRPGTLDQFLRDIKRTVTSEDILDLRKFLGLAVFADLKQNRLVETSPTRNVPDLHKNSWILALGTGKQLVRPTEVSDIEASIENYFDLTEDQPGFLEQRLHIGQVGLAGIKRDLLAQNILSGVGSTITRMVRAGSVPAQLELGEVIAWPIIPKSA